MLVDAGLPSVGFVPKARNVNQFAGIQWTETKHNLDRIFEKDGILYGTEIKNRLSYISQDEFLTKLKMCETLRLRPLFVARMMPRSYVYELFKKGGFALLMKFQFYPFGSESFAANVRKRLALPVDCPKVGRRNTPTPTQLPQPRYRIWALGQFVFIRVPRHPFVSYGLTPSPREFKSRFASTESAPHSSVPPRAQGPPPPRPGLQALDAATARPGRRGRIRGWCSSPCE